MAYAIIDDPEKHFNTKTYTGNLLQHPVVGLNHQPDFLWFKNRDSTNSHNIIDTTRGTDKKLEGTDRTNAEGDTTTRLDSFDTDGFTVETDPSVNGSNNEIVVWSWKANGGSRTTFAESGDNPGGGHQANTTAGISIVDYTGTGSAGTVQHGLGVIPEMIIFKDRSEASAWVIYHEKIGNGAFLKLDTNAAKADESSNFNNTSPTSSVFTVGNAIGMNGGADNLLAAVFELYFTGEVEDNTHRSGLRTYWIYRYDRKAFYPFVPTGDKEGERDRPTEARLGQDLRKHGLIIEKSLTEWMGLWGIPF